MRAAMLILAVLFSLAAIGGRLTGQPGWVPVAAILAAGAFLVAGLWLQAKKQVPRSIELDDAQREKIRELKAGGNHSGAVGQVQLWFKYATPEQARQAVAEV